jgi:MFS family permease
VAYAHFSPVSFTDAYDVFAISIAAAMIGRVYASSGTLTANQDLGIKVATPVGTLIGQLLFGWLADVFGRKKLYGIEVSSRPSPLFDLHSALLASGRVMLMPSRHFLSAHDHLDRYPRTSRRRSWSWCLSHRCSRYVAGEF